MKKDFNTMLWELGVNNPELRGAIARTVAKKESYSIPVRTVSQHTGELEDFTITIQEIEDPEKREKAIARLQQARKMTVEELATRLSVLHIAYSVKEAKGEELTPVEKTLKDLDINVLAYVLRFTPYPKEAYKTFDSPEELGAYLKDKK